jgi:hypothetical protein
MVGIYLTCAVVLVFLAGQVQEGVDSLLSDHVSGRSIVIMLSIADLGIVGRTATVCQ